MINYSKELKEKIYKDVFYNYYRAVHEFGEKRVFGVFPYGSMNYGSFTNSSDVDVRVVIIPSIQDIFKNERFLSKEEKIDDNKVTYTDIRNFVKGLCNASPTHIEMIFSPFYYINPLYEDFYNKHIYEKREEIGKMNTPKLLKSCLGMMKAFKNPKERTYKKAYHYVRLAYFCANVINETPLEECFVTPAKINDIKFAEAFDINDYDTCVADASIIVPDIEKYIEIYPVDVEKFDAMVENIYNIFADIVLMV